MKTSADFFIIKLLPTALSCKIVIVEEDKNKSKNKESNFKTNEKGWRIKQKG